MKNSLRSFAVAASVIACLAVGTSPATAATAASEAPALGAHALKGGASPSGVFPDDFLCKIFRGC